MAQLNPNFEIDFNDINSYEQIQLINDTQLAKENLLMHRAYKEPSDDEIIKNHFSSFTFVDFCPKVFRAASGCLASGQTGPSSSTTPTNLHRQRSSDIYQSAPKVSDTPPAGLASRGQVSLRSYELESFSDLFERINSWLKLNKDWRVVSVETLVYDYKSQFNHLKSSIYSSSLPQSTRGLRLFLSPSKSRFSGPQKIGCINVVPRKLSGSHSGSPHGADSDLHEPVVYEDLDQVLKRLNELLLTRPIEGRILSVETLTLPIVDGYVNTESNFFPDSRLSLLFERTYNLISVTSGESALPRAASGHQLVDILRVYYEFGPAMCGLVNLLDFVPRFYSPVRPADDESSSSTNTSNSDNEQEDQQPRLAEAPLSSDKIAATESTTRLIRRSLTWFEAERKRILDETKLSHKRGMALNLKVCNVQVRNKILLKSQLLCMNSANALDRIQTRQMAHEPAEQRTPISCSRCQTSTSNVAPQDWCSHLVELSQPYQLKFVRLAYVVPVTSKHTLFAKVGRPLKSDNSIGCAEDEPECPDRIPDKWTESLGAPNSSPTPILSHDDGDKSAVQQSSPSETSSSDSCEGLSAIELSELHSDKADSIVDSRPEEVDADVAAVELLRQTVFSVVQRTIERHRLYEEAHQLQQINDDIYSAPIGQLTYRLFAPCQLVKSSSCFSINPVNSSSPLSRRGSVNINGNGMSSDGASASTLLLGPSQTCHLQSQIVSAVQNEVASFGAFFPASPHEQLYQDVLGNNKSSKLHDDNQLADKLTTNEFESVQAIRRRMEVYVTTNSMKVIAGETVLVNLSDALSCLSTSIEQTVVRSAFGSNKRPSTWVSVYILYAAVDEPLLPAHLLAQQRLRDLNLSPRTTRSPEILDKQTIDSIFDDDFKNSADLRQGGASPSMNGVQRTPAPSPSESRSFKGDRGASSKAKGSRHGSIQEDGKEEVNRSEQASPMPTPYNSAYDRTVALPTQPDDNSPGLEMLDLAGLPQADCLWPF